MLTSANVKAAQAGSYYERDDYYTQGDPDIQSDTRWQGKGAAELGLEGPIEQAAFQQLLEGETPQGKSLHSRIRDPQKHRAATDYTFSAPKSVSIAGLIQKDKRVIQAHDSAVEKSLSVLEERYAQTRVTGSGGVRERVNTGNIIAATFRHETSREQDPQLHTHCVVINATQLSDGRWQSMSNEAVMSNKKLLGEIYQNELAVQLRQLGYEIAPQGNGLFECAGYEKPLLKLFSTRSQQIEKYVEQWEESLKEKGGKPLHAGQKKQATLATRLRKQSVPREVLLQGWKEAIESGDIHLPAIPEKGLIAARNQAQVAATEGVNHASERESVFRQEKVERFALEHHLGEQSFDELQAAIAQTDLVPAQRLFTTETAIARELDTISIMQGGQDQVAAISTLAAASERVASELTLSEGQRLAILETAISRDQFIAWQGVAGAGKTYSLKLLAQLATAQGYEVRGYAPSAQAANVLAEETGVEGNTVARLLHSQDRNDSAGKAIWIVDEAGLLSAKDAHKLLKKAQVNSARVILVGDTRQLSAVEAGNPFRSLQSAGLKTTFLEESRRQKTEALRASVVCLAAGEQREGLETLDRAGMIDAVESDAIRQITLTRDYIRLSPEKRARMLILSGTNAERLELTSSIRKALQAEGTLGEDTFEMDSLRSRDRTAAQLKYAIAYELNDVVVPVKDYRRYGMQRRAQYRVVGRDIETNRLTLQAADGREFTFNPATCAEKTSYEVQQLTIAPGDQLRWTRNEAVEGVRNGQVVTVESVDRAGVATVCDTKGEVMKLALTGQQYLDYALVSTTYSSQGKTADQVLAAIDSTVSKEGLYVAVSRAKSDLTLYTTNKDQLYKKAQRSAAKVNPSDYLTLFEMVNRDVQSQESADHSRPLRGADQSEYISDRVGENVGNLVGESVEAIHRTAMRRDPVATPGSASAQSTAERTTTGARRTANRHHRRRALVVKHSPQRDRYRRYAAQYVGSSAQACDRFVARRMISELLERNGGRSLNQEELKQVALVVTQGETTKRLRRTAGREAGLKYLTELIISENKAVENSRRPANSQPEPMATVPTAAESTASGIEAEQKSQKVSKPQQRVQKTQKKPVQKPKRKAKKRQKKQDNGMEM